MENTNNNETMDDLVTVQSLFNSLTTCVGEAAPIYVEFRGGDGYSTIHPVKMAYEIKGVLTGTKVCDVYSSEEDRLKGAIRPGIYLVINGDDYIDG